MYEVKASFRSADRTTEVCSQAIFGPFGERVEADRCVQILAARMDCYSAEITTKGEEASK